MVSSSRSYKQRVTQSFSKHAQTYDSSAGLQLTAAQITAAFIDKNKDSIPDGPILEVGCGTGLLSAQLTKIFPDRKIIFSDISPEMVEKCKSKIKISKKRDSSVSFIVLDGEDLKTHSEYAAIVSSFAIQWFFQPFKGISRLVSALRANGSLIFSIPGSESCSEWRDAAERAEVPFTRNPLPSYEELINFAEKMGLSYEIQQQNAQESYPSAAQLLYSIRELGAATQKSDVRLSCGQVRKLMRELDRDEPTKLSYQILTALYRRI